MSVRIVTFMFDKSSIKLSQAQENSFVNGFFISNLSNNNSLTENNECLN